MHSGCDAGIAAEEGAREIEMVAGDWYSVFRLRGLSIGIQMQSELAS